MNNNLIAQGSKILELSKQIQEELNKCRTNPYISINIDRFTISTNSVQSMYIGGNEIEGEIPTKQ